MARSVIDHSQNPEIGSVDLVIVSHVTLMVAALPSHLVTFLNIHEF